LDLVVAVSTEGHDKEGRIVVKGIVARDGDEEVTLYVLILGAPDFFSTFVDDGVLVWVVGDGSGARWGSEEVGEEFSFRGDREREVRENGSGWGGRGDDGDRCFDNGWQEVFDGDVGKGNLFDNFFELEVDVCVLVFGGWGILKLRAYDVSLLGGNVSENVKEVGWSGNDGGW
jgi:hypothetical protein